MRAAIAFMFALVLAGCAAKNGAQEQILFRSSDLTVSEREGTILATYTYPACIVQSEQRHEIQANFRAQNSEQRTGIVTIVGAVIGAVLKVALD